MDHQIDDCCADMEKLKMLEKELKNSKKRLLKKCQLSTKTAKVKSSKVSPIKATEQNWEKFFEIGEMLENINKKPTSVLDLLGLFYFFRYEFFY